MLLPFVHRIAGVVVGPRQEDVRCQGLVSGERLQSEVSGPFCCQPLLGCIDGSSVRRGRKESVARLSLMTYRQHRNRLLGQALAA